MTVNLDNTKALNRIADALEAIARSVSINGEQAKEGPITPERNNPLCETCFKIIAWVLREADVNIKDAEVLRKDYREGSRTADVVIERLANNAEQFRTDFHLFAVSFVAGESEQEADE